MGKSEVIPIEEFPCQDYPTRFAASIRNFEVGEYLDKKQGRRVDPFIRYAILAGKKAMLHQHYSCNNILKVFWIRTVLRKIFTFCEKWWIKCLLFFNFMLFYFQPTIVAHRSLLEFFARIFHLIELQKILQIEWLNELIAILMTVRPVLKISEDIKVTMVPIEV